MYNLYIYTNTNNSNNYIKFPDFVYSWLHKFYICPTHRIIKSYELDSSSIDFNNKITDLLVFIHNVKA